MHGLLTRPPVQGAIEWLEANQDQSYEEIIAASASSADADEDPNAEPAALEPGEQPRSLVCNECGKKFRSQGQAEFHASKTQHVDFAESTEEIAPLTEEEKKARLEELRQKLAEKRAGMSDQDKIDKKRNEVCPSALGLLMLRLADGCPGYPTEEYERDSRHQGRSEEERAA